MQAIQTKFLGPTNTKGSRVKATCWIKSITVAWDHALNAEENHKRAIQLLVDKLNEERKQKLEAFDGHIDNRPTQKVWKVIATGSSADGKGETAIIDLVETD